MDGQVIQASDRRIGRVVAVAGSQIVVLLDGPLAIGAATQLQMGELVKARRRESTIFGMITGLSIPLPSPSSGGKETRIAEIELIGEAVDGSDGLRGRFQRGVSSLPMLGDQILRTTQEDLADVYARPSVASVRIGTLHHDRELPAYVAVDDLLGKHFAVVGTTGSGKSTAVVVMLRAILERSPHGHIVLLDPHNEYSHAFGDAAEVLGPGTLQLPYWLFNFEEIVEVVLNDGDEDRNVQRAILNEAVVWAKRGFTQNEETRVITADTPVPYRLSDVARFLEDAKGRLEKPESLAPYMRLSARLNALQLDPRFAFMFGGLVVRDNLRELLSRIFRVPVNGKPITIIDLSGIPSEILNVVVSVLCRVTLDFALWNERTLPVLLVCEEAHRYVPQDTGLGFEPTKRVLARIAKEGRKYGVALCVVSQRPSELATTMLSECNTIFALRMTSQKDQEIVRDATSESAQGLLGFLPALRNGEAIAVGEGVQVPVRLRFEELAEGRQPRSATASFSAAWSEDVDNSVVVASTVDRWRGRV